jgi:lysozyme
MSWLLGPKVAPAPVPAAPVIAPPPSLRDRAMALAVPFIREAEGCYLTAYHGAEDRPGVCTIGVGSITIDGRPVRLGDTITQAQADAMLAEEMKAKADAVDALAPPDATPGECAACYSFAYNLGVNAFSGSTLAKKWHAGDRPGAAAEFAGWCHSNGKVVPGLVTRRARERALFLGAPQ